MQNKDRIMVDEGVVDKVKDESVISDSMAIAESSSYFAETPNTNSIKNGHLGLAEDRFLQANSCYCNITAIDIRIKNMHKQWSTID
jgi:hypothetical protein